MPQTTTQMRTSRHESFSAPQQDNHQSLKYISLVFMFLFEDVLYLHRVVQSDITRSYVERKIIFLYME